MAVSARIGCGWCLDFAYFQAFNEHLDVDKAREVPRWRDSAAFTPLERAVLGYAEAMTQTPPVVTDEMVAELLEQLGAAALVELTAFIAIANMNSRGNVALGIESEEYAQSCDLKALATPARLARMTDDPFVAHRSLLFTVAYELLGSAADAEDAVQETWLRWDGIGADGQAEVADSRAYLVRIVTRQALNRLRTLARRKEEYVGEWLPEPLLTTPDVAEDVELAESVSIAMLTVLETLTPTERAVFVLREVFDLPFDEIAAATGKSAAAVRQVAHRARSHVAARRPRMEVDRAEQRRVVDRFLMALRTGDLQGLMDALAPDAVLIADGGGLAAAVRQPVDGAKKIVNLLGGFARIAPTAVVEPVVLNGAPGARIIIDGTVDTVVGFAFEDGRISRIFAVRNPDKLHRLTAETPLTR
jgi:RNA polymerase sigma-70 factor (TIGR02957 family)